MLSQNAAITKKKHKRSDIPKKPDWWNYEITEDHIISIPWIKNDVVDWNETCANVLEVFGLPGQRFYYKPYPTKMTFTFKSKKDADLCRVLLSEKLYYS